MERPFRDTSNEYFHQANTSFSMLKCWEKFSGLPKGIRGNKELDFLFQRNIFQSQLYFRKILTTCTSRAPF